MLRPQINASDVAHHRVQMKLAEVTVQGSRFADLGPETLDSWHRECVAKHSIRRREQWLQGQLGGGGMIADNEVAGQ